MSKAVKISVALDRETIEIADRRAQEEHSNRSQIIRKAILRMLREGDDSPKKAA